MCKNLISILFDISSNITMDSGIHIVNTNNGHLLFNPKSGGFIIYSKVNSPGHAVKAERHVNLLLSLIAVQALY